MFGLSPREVRFGLVISATHLGQHFLMRLIPPLIPALAVAFEYPLWQLGLLVSLYALGQGVIQAPLGVLSDRYDRLYLLPTGITVAGLGYVLVAGAPVLEAWVPGISLLGHSFEGGFLVMGVGMLVVGLGCSVVHPTAYPMITVNTAPGNKGKVLGAFGSSAKFGDAAAPAVIGVLILVLVWHRILLILGVVGAIFGVVLFFVFRGDEFDTLPAARRNAATRTGASSTSIWKAERRTYLYPLAVIYLFFISKMFSGEGIKTFLPAFIVAVYAYSFEVWDVSFAPESVANFYFAAMLLFAGVIQLWVGGLTDRFDTRVVLLSGAVMAVVGFLSLSLFDLGPALLLVVLCLVSVGIYGLAPARDALISDISPPELEGRTFGYIWTAISLTGVAMPPVVGYIIETQGMREGFLVLTSGVVLATGIVTLLFVDRVYRKRADSGVEPGRTDQSVDPPVESD